MSNEVAAESWEVEMDRVNIVSKRQIRLDSTGAFEIDKTAGNIEVCQPSDNPDILGDTQSLIKNLLDSYDIYSWLIFRNRCSDNTYYKLEFSEGSQKLRIDYFGPPLCIGLKEDIPEIYALTSHLELLHKRLKEC